MFIRISFVKGQQLHNTHRLAHRKSIFVNAAKIIFKKVRHTFLSAYLNRRASQDKANAVLGRL